jgi:hypothetical protein
MIREDVRLPEGKAFVLRQNSAFRWMAQNWQEPEYMGIRSCMAYRRSTRAQEPLSGIH